MMPINSATPPKRPAVTSDGALRIARLDGEKTYRDLSRYRVSVVLEAEGWHVDYQLKDPNLGTVLGLCCCPWTQEQVGSPERSCRGRIFDLLLEVPSTGIWAWKNNHMQRLYETVFAVGLLMMPFCIGLAFLFCLSASPMSPALVVLSWVAMVCPLVVACLTLRCLSRWWALRWPQFISRSRYIWVHRTAWLLCMGTMLYGFCWWPAAPLVHRDDTYIDKAGKLHTHAEFDAFERWESALNCVFLAFAICSVLGMPVSPWPTYRRTISDQSAAATQG